MIEKEIVNIVKEYIQRLTYSGVRVTKAVIFGSFAGNKQVDQFSDIDVMIISPYFDSAYTREDINNLWRLAAEVDSRIEPVPVGEAQWQEDNSSHLIEVARREGFAVDLDHSLA